MPSRINATLPLLWILLLCLFVAGCGSEPQNTAEMLEYIHDNVSDHPEKTREVYNRFGVAGEEALISSLFHFETENKTLYTKKIEKLVKQPQLWSFAEQLSAHDDFLLKIIIYSDQYRKEPIPSLPQSEFTWVQTHNPTLFLDWLARISTEDSRFIEAWKTHLKKDPHAAIKSALALIESHKNEIVSQPIAPAWASQLLQACHKALPDYRFSPEEYHFIFANNFEEMLFRAWKLDFKDWLRVCPEDVKLAVLGKNGTKIPATTLATTSELGELLSKTMLTKDYMPENAVEPSESGQKVMIYYDGSDVYPYVSERLLSSKGIPIGMLSWLPHEAIPDHLLHYDKTILIRPYVEKVFTYANGTTALQWRMNIYCIDVQSGEVLDEKEFTGTPPASDVTIPSDTKYHSGSLPMQELALYIQQIALE